ncbi:MAG: glutamate--tRNA ligase, partial [Janthinobacterium lividum]
MKIVTRFAPSPTGYLHIGGARTALFNYLFAKANGGRFLLRIEDTDKERLNEDAIEAIFDGLRWLNIDWEGQVVFQSKREERHKNIVEELIKKDKAYYCFVSQDEIDLQRNVAISDKRSFIFESPWRDADPLTYPKDVKSVVRLKVPKKGETKIHDELQGDIIIENQHLDDMILLRSDGSPTYMLAAVVDDHDMEITYIIRGDDHLTNATRQALIYRAMDWQEPSLVHIPLIHSQDGAKLSKRHGALGIDAYRNMGYLPEAICNYLLRLGWSHGNDEIIGRSEAINLFTLDGLNRGACRLDFAKMNSLNAHYLRNLDNQLLTNMVVKYLGDIIEVKQEYRVNIEKAMDSIKLRAERINDLADLAKIYICGFDPHWSSEEQKILEETDKNLLINAAQRILELPQVDKKSVELTLKDLARESNIKIGQLMIP